MAQLGTVLAIVLSVNVLLFLGQVAVINLNPNAPQFYTCNGSMIGQFDSYGCSGPTYVLDDSNPIAKLPNTGGQVEVSSGNIFTDTFSAATNWFSDTIGLSYLYSIVMAPKNFLVAIGLPDSVSFALGAMWYGFTLLTIVAFVLGRDY